MPNSRAGLPGGIASRLLVAFMIVSAVTVAMGVAGLTQLGKLHTQAERIYGRGALPLAAVRKIEGAWFHFTFTRLAGQSTIIPDAQKAVFRQQLPQLSRTWSRRCRTREACSWSRPPRRR